MGKLGDLGIGEFDGGFLGGLVSDGECWVEGMVDVWVCVIKGVMEWGV